MSYFIEVVHNTRGAVERDGFDTAHLTIRDDGTLVVYQDRVKRATYFAPGVWKTAQSLEEKR